LCYKSGQWDEVHTKQSSNFRELGNLIYTIEEQLSIGQLRDTELFIFTDNSTAESAFYNGTASSPTLFELVLRLRNLQMNQRLLVHFVHVAGTKMMAQGTDGLSRGSMLIDALQGDRFMEFIPLHLSADERQGESLLCWIESWYSHAEEYTHLNPSDWFQMGHHATKCLWTPPPAAAEAALEQLAKSIHKRPHHMHLVVIPRLMTARWRKMLGKICDLIFTVPVGTLFWSNTQFEPLIVGLYLPLSRHKPWRLKGTPMLDRVEGQLRDLPTTCHEWGRDILRKLLEQSRKLDSLPESVVRPLLCTA
jgi:hypothetical protein